MTVKNTDIMQWTYAVWLSGHKVMKQQQLFQGYVAKQRWKKPQTNYLSTPEAKAERFYEACL